MNMKEAMTSDEARATSCGQAMAASPPVRCLGNGCQFWVEVSDEMAEYAPPGGGQNVFVPSGSLGPKDGALVHIHSPKGRCAAVVTAMRLHDLMFTADSINVLLGNRL